MKSKPITIREVVVHYPEPDGRYLPSGKYVNIDEMTPEEFRRQGQAINDAAMKAINYHRVKCQ